MYWFALAVALLSSTVGHAFEDPALALAAGQYRTQTEQLGTHTEAGTSLGALVLGRKAQRLAARKQWDAAIDLYRQAIALGANDTDTWLGLGLALRATKAGDAAMDAVYNGYLAAQSDPQRAEALFLLGELYEQQTQFKLAMAALREGLQLQPDADYQQRYERLHAAHAFRLLGVDTEAEATRPRVCLRFSAPLAEDQGRRPADPHYQDYLLFEPAIQPVVSARGQRLCIAGVEHGHAYKLTVRLGLPAADGERLTRSKAFRVRVPDRKPSVGFRGSAYVLPAAGRRSLPLTTVNVERVKIRLLRINDRNLVQQINQRRIDAVLDGYAIETIADRSGELLWQGRMDIAMEKNREVSTGIPIGEVLGATRPGIYVVSATPTRADAPNPEDYKKRATQWLVVSDLGLSTFSASDGLHVLVRSLARAHALGGVELRLYARNNGLLGRALSDTDGHARFAPGLLRGKGGKAPAALMAYNDDNDFVFLDLTRPGFDLGDRGVGGRAAPGPIDAYLYTDRGVYRPGERVQLMTLLRDRRGDALQRLPITIKVTRPDGVEARSLVLEPDQGGGAHTTLALSDNARSGRWTARAFVDPDGKPVGQVGFLVEDFVPQRLKLTLDSAAKDLFPQQAISIQASSEFLYGAPAADLRTRAEVVLQRLDNPYPDYAGYHFGLAHERWTPTRTPLPMPPTDAAGHSRLQLRLDRRPDTSLPLKAVVRVSVFEPGGRALTRSLSLPYRTRPFDIGIRAGFGDEPLGEGKPAEFEVIALDQRGRPIQLAGLRYELLREKYRYHWYYRDNRWDYKLIVDDGEVVADGELGAASAAAKVARIRQTGLDWGRYRLEVYDPDSGIASSLRFRVGWYAGPGAGDTPDKLQLTLDRPRYRAGDTARVHIQAPFAGSLQLSVAAARLWQTTSYDLPAGGTTIELPIKADWGPGTYLIANAFRPALPPQSSKVPGQAASTASAQPGPGPSTARPGPGRAIGIAWLPLDSTERTLDLSLNVPEEVTPRRRIQVPVEVKGAQPGAPVRITLAAVDEGILQLTGFASPDPLDYYFGKRRLGVELRDLYGRLITPADGPIGKLRVGGGMDSRQMQGTQVRTVQTVALFQGPVQIGADGRASVPLDLPDFNGRLRLMAVAYSPTRLGRAETALLVRDPLVARVYLPRFLAPGDQAAITLQLHNLSAPAGDYRIRLQTEGPISLGETVDFTLHLPAGAPRIAELHSALPPAEPNGTLSSSNQQPSANKQTGYTLTATQPGLGHLRLRVDGPAGLSLEHRTPIQVRAARAILTERMSLRLLPGAELRLGNDLIAPFTPTSAQARLSFATRPDWDVPSLTRALDRYPYGCAEQTTSRALPWLYAAQLADDRHTKAAPEARDRVQQAIGHLLDLQGPDGGFALWDPNSPSHQWLSAYALDFLLRAAQMDYLVPDQAVNAGLRYLQAIVTGNDYQATHLAARSYALYVLARAGKAPLGQLRYLFDNHLAHLPSPLARAQLGAALARYGDRGRARRALLSALDNPERLDKLHDYGSPLRDQAAVLTLLEEAGLLAERQPGLSDRVAENLAATAYTSTQEKAWLVLAAVGLTHAVDGSDAEPVLCLSGLAPAMPTAEDNTQCGTDAQPVPWRHGRYQLEPTPADLNRGLTLRNGGRIPLWYTLTLSGIPASDQPAEQAGYRIARQFYNLQGEPVDLGAVVQNDVLVAVISGHSPARSHPHSLVVDLLPAGLELENARLAGGQSSAGLDWLPTLAATLHTELRDDRYIAALDLRKDQGFSLAYLVRAVTPGRFRVPAVFIEDMYRPAYRARGPMAEMRIAPPAAP